MEASTALTILICALGIGIAVVVARKIVLSSKIEPDESHTTAGKLPETGVRAVVSKTLRPVGVIEAEGTFYEAISEGEFIEPGSEVTIIGKKGARALVRKDAKQIERGRQV